MTWTDNRHRDGTQRSPHRMMSLVEMNRFLRDDDDGRLFQNARAFAFNHTIIGKFHADQVEGNHLERNTFGRDLINPKRSLVYSATISGVTAYENVWGRLLSMGCGAWLMVKSYSTNAEAGRQRRDAVLALLGGPRGSTSSLDALNRAQAEMIKSANAKYLQVVPIVPGVTFSQRYNFESKLRNPEYAFYYIGMCVDNGAYNQKTAPKDDSGIMFDEKHGALWNPNFIGDMPVDILVRGPELISCDPTVIADFQLRRAGEYIDPKDESKKKVEKRRDFDDGHDGQRFQPPMIDMGTRSVRWQGLKIHEQRTEVCREVNMLVMGATALQNLGITDQKLTTFLGMFEKIAKAADTIVKGNTPKPSAGPQAHSVDDGDGFGAGFNGDMPKLEDRDDWWHYLKDNMAPDYVQCPSEVMIRADTVYDEELNPLYAKWSANTTTALNDAMESMKTYVFEAVTDGGTGYAKSVAAFMYIHHIVLSKFDSGDMAAIQAGIADYETVYVECANVIKNISAVGEGFEFVEMTPGSRQYSSLIRMNEVTYKGIVLEESITESDFVIPDKYACSLPMPSGEFILLCASTHKAFVKAYAIALKCKNDNTVDGFIRTKSPNFYSSFVLSWYEYKKKGPIQGDCSKVMPKLRMIEGLFSEMRTICDVMQLQMKYSYVAGLYFDICEAPVDTITARAIERIKHILIRLKCITPDTEMSSVRRNFDDNVRDAISTDIASNRFVIGHKFRNSNSTDVFFDEALDALYAYFISCRARINTLNPKFPLDLTYSVQKYCFITPFAPAGMNTVNACADALSKLYNLELSSLDINFPQLQKWYNRAAVALFCLESNTVPHDTSSSIGLDDTEVRLGDLIKNVRSKLEAVGAIDPPPPPPPLSTE